jgi:hypothetical protein
MIWFCLILTGFLVTTLGLVFFLYTKKSEHIYQKQETKPISIIAKPTATKPLIIDWGMKGSFICKTEENEVNERDLKRRRAIFGIN